MNNIVDLIRPDLRDFNSYRSARDETQQDHIWLDANESPYTYLTQEGFAINRYPKKRADALINQLAEIYQVAAEQILLTRGSDEGIDLLLRLFCVAGKDAIMTCPPTFDMYAVYGKLQGVRNIAVPLLKNNYQLDVEAMLSYRQSEVKIIFLCSPNNPTGNLLSHEDISNLCQYYANTSIIVVDEAYIEFSTDDSCTKYINNYNNLVILRTFSKAYGLAGVRCGLLLAQKDTVQWLRKIMPPYPLPTSTLHYIQHTVNTERLQQIRQHITWIKSERERLFTALQSLSCVRKVWASETNFLLLEVVDVNKVMEETAKAGIIIRSMQNKFFLNNAVRITVGLPEENTKLLATLSRISI